MSGRFSFNRLKSIFRSFKKEKDNPLINNKESFLIINVTYANDPYQILHIAMKNLKEFKEDSKLQKYIYEPSIIYKLNKINTETYTDTVEFKNTDMVKNVLSEIYKYFPDPNTTMSIGYIEITLTFTKDNFDEVSTLNCNFIRLVKLSCKDDVYTIVYHVYYDEVILLMRHYVNNDLGKSIINDIFSYIPTCFFKDIPDYNRLFSIYKDCDKLIYPEYSYIIGNTLMPICNVSITDNIKLLTYDNSDNSKLYFQLFDLTDEEKEILMFMNTEFIKLSDIIAINTDTFVRVFNDVDTDNMHPFFVHVYDSIISFNINHNVELKEIDNSNLFYEGIDEIIDD